VLKVLLWHSMKSSDGLLTAMRTVKSSVQILTKFLFEWRHHC